MLHYLTNPDHLRAVLDGHVDPSAGPLDLLGARISRQRISHVAMGHTRLRMARLTFVEFDDVDLRQAGCDRIRMEGGWFRRCVLQQASFQRAELERVHLDDIHGEESVWREADLHLVSFVSGSLAGACFFDVDLELTQFYGTDISGADFRDARASSQLLKQAVWRRSTPPLLPSHLSQWLDTNRARFCERVMGGDRWVYDHEEQGWPERKLSRYPHLDSGGD